MLLRALRSFWIDFSSFPCWYCTSDGEWICNFLLWFCVLEKEGVCGELSAV